MKKVFIVVIVAIMFVGANAQAAAPVHHVTVLPGGLLYNFKILGESIWQKIVSVSGPEAEMNYLAKRINNRYAEIRTLIDNGSVNSDAYIQAVSKSNQLKSDFAVLLGKVQESKRLKVAEAGTASFLNFQDDYPAFMLQKMSDVRQQVLDAQKAGDTEKAFRLITTLKDLNRVYTETNVAFTVSWVFDKEEIDQTESVLAGADKLAFALDWANQHKSMLAETSRSDLYASDLELLKQSIRKVDGLIADLEKIPLDQAGGPKVDAVFGPARATLNDMAMAIHQKNLKDSVAKQLPEETAPSTEPQTQQSSPQPQPQPQTNQPPAQNPAPAPSKPKLKTIPSESVQRSPLVLHYWKIVNGEAGTDVNTQYTAEGGLPPYHFQLGSGVGFPPHNVVLDANGLLSGTPDIAGTSNFSICVVDTAGQSVCGNTVMKVGVAPELIVTSRACSESNDFYNNPSHYSGTATVGIGGYIEYGSLATFTPFQNRMINLSTVTCDAWPSHTLSDGVVNKNACVRGPNDPPTTNWTVSSPMSLTDNNEQEISSYMELFTSNWGNHKVVGLYCP